MNRSDFLRKLGIGIGVAVVAPKVLADNPITKNGYTEPLKPFPCASGYNDVHIEENSTRHHYCLGDEVYDAEGNLWIITKVSYWGNNTFFVVPIEIDVNGGRGIYVDAEIFPNFFKPTHRSCLLKFA